MLIQTKQEKADGSFTGDLKDVAVSGSFTIKDTQDTAASIKVKKNNLNSSGKAHITSAVTTTKKVCFAMFLQKFLFFFLFIY